MRNRTWFLIIFFVVASISVYAIDCKDVEKEFKFFPVRENMSNPSSPEVFKFSVLSGSLDPESGSYDTTEIRRPAKSIARHAEVMLRIQGRFKDLREKIEDPPGSTIMVPNPNYLKWIDGTPVIGEEKVRQLAEEDAKYRKASVGIMVPYCEPFPVERNQENELLCIKGKIFKNTGTGSGDFPFAVKALVSDAGLGVEAGKFYIFKNVSYEWTFEKGDEDDDSDTRSNKAGSSGESPWSPFLNESKVLNEATDFIPKYAESEVDADAFYADGNLKKCYVNRHNTSFDSGIGSMENPMDSKSLQMVKMTLKYDRAEVTVTGESGSGFPSASTSADNSDGSINVDSSLQVSNTNLDQKTEENPEGVEWISKAETVPLPAKYSSLSAWAPTAGNETLVTDAATDYRLLYVEDYKEPDAEDVPYSGDGTGSFFKTVAGEKLDRDIAVQYENVNEELATGTEAAEQFAKLKYYFGNGDMYKVTNPAYQNTDFRQEKKPFLNFVYLKGNKNFGPYIGPVTDGVKNFITEWYTVRHTYWSAPGVDEKLRDKYIANRFAEALPADSIPLWHMGVVFYAFGTDDGEGSVDRMLKLNDSWKKDKSINGNTSFQSTLEAYTAMGSTGSYAKSALEALQKVVNSPTAADGVEVGTIHGQPFRSWFRFAYLGFDPAKGSFCYGPMDLEKDNPAVIKEEVVDKSGVQVTSGTLTVHEDRVIMPSFYADESTDQSSSDLFSTSQSVQVVLANCCGAVTTVTPGVESDRQGMTISDSSNGAETSTPGKAEPVPQLTLSDGGNEANVVVPTNMELKDGETLLYSDNPTGPFQQFAANQFTGDLDLTNKTFKIKKIDGTETGVTFTPVDDAIDGPAHMVVNEDERVEIRTGGYDNLDYGTNFKGLSKVELQIFGEDGTPEMLEFIDPATGNMTKNTVLKHEAGIDGISTTEQRFVKLLNFDPNVQIFHIFRNPGMYKAVYEVTEAAVAGKSRQLTFNIRVRDIKQRNRALENSTNRQ